MVMSIPNIFEFLYFAAKFILSTNRNSCCLLYFNANIMCSFTKSFSFWGTSSPTLTGAPLLDPAGNFRLPDTQSSFMSPNNPVRSTPWTLGVHVYLEEVRRWCYWLDVGPV